MLKLGIRYAILRTKPHVFGNKLLINGMFARSAINILPELGVNGFLDSVEDCF
jgi:hypothetical protein